jgi:integrase
MEAAAGIENILKAIRRSELNSDDALRIVQALRERDLIDITAVKSGKGSVLFTEFHSWRHYYAARMADCMTADQVSRITGHKSRAVFEKYADHITEENLEEVGKVGAEVFKNILQFRKVG